MVVLAEGIPVILETSIKNDLKVTYEQLKQAIADKTKWIIINSPSNPTGSCYSIDELKNIIKFWTNIHIR